MCFYLSAELFQAQKNDLIAELKRSRDIGGIKKVRVERARSEERNETDIFCKLSKQYSVENFVDQVRCLPVLKKVSNLNKS